MNPVKACFSYRNANSLRPHSGAITRSSPDAVMREVFEPSLPKAVFGDRSILTRNPIDLPPVQIKDKKLPPPRTPQAKT